MIDPSLLFVVFALLAASGAYGLAAHFHSRRLGVLLALVTLLFLAAVFGGVQWLLATHGGNRPLA